MYFRTAFQEANTALRPNAPSPENFFNLFKNQEWFIKYCSTDAGLQRYSGNVFTTNNITNSIMTAQCH